MICSRRSPKTAGSKPRRKRSSPRRSEEAARRVDLRASVRQHERRPGAGIFQRRDHRGHHHRPVEGFGTVRGRAQHRLHVQGQGRWTSRKSRSALDVTHVLEGSVRKAGDRVRITAQLIDGKAGDHVWADRYDRDLTDIFAIQDEISKAIVAALQAQAAARREEGDRDARHRPASRLIISISWPGSIGSAEASATSAATRRSSGFASRRCRFDPNYAEAWALMALAQSQLRLWHARDVDALPAAERALSINPNLAEARCVKAHVAGGAGQARGSDRRDRDRAPPRSRILGGQPRGGAADVPAGPDRAKPFPSLKKPPR